MINIFVLREALTIYRLLTVMLISKVELFHCDSEAKTSEIIKKYLLVIVW